MSDLPGDVERLAARLETLERRVYTLEHPAEECVLTPVQEPAALQAVQAAEAELSGQAGGVFSVLGKALLGIAGAYVLRAVAESSSLPKLAIAAIAILYAVAWLVAATQTRAGAWRTSTTYACTSALILSPMLWELTLRFKVLPPAMGAGILCGYALGASALAWKRDFTPVFWVANGTAALTALALTLATHDMPRFIAALLLIVIACEFAALRNHELSVRPLVAVAADLAVWALIFLYASPSSTRADYPVLSTATLLAFGFSLFPIYGASVALRTTLYRQKISIFEIIQCMIAFLLAACSLIYFQPRGMALLGGLCLVLAGATYAATFVFFDHAPERRDYQVFGAWSAALFLGGSLLSLQPVYIATGLAVAAVMTTVLGVRLRRQSLEFHGLVYLVAAAVASGLLDYVFRALAGTLPGVPGWSVCVVSACAVVCYAAKKPCAAERWQQQLLHLVSASLALGGTAALLVQGLAGLTALGLTLGAHHVAFIRTLIICLAALALAYSGAHWRRMELTRIGYATLVLAAAKLVLEDLRHGHLEFIAASIFLFAVTLMAVPRLARMGSRA